MNRERSMLTAALVLVSSAGCGTPPLPEPALTPAPEPARVAQQAPPPADPSKPLEGRWRIELSLDPLSMPNPPQAERVTGEIAFGSSAWWGSVDRFGRHSVDLRPFFGRTLARPDGVAPFSAGDTSMVTEVSGSISGDSVGIDFIPRIDHIGISFWGRFYGDSAVGRWRRRGMDGAGRFWLRRETREPVSVAAIPVYARLGPAAVAATTTVASGDTAGGKDKASAASKTAGGAKGTKGATKVAAAKGTKSGAAAAKTIAAGTPKPATGTASTPASAASTTAGSPTATTTVAAAPVTTSPTPTPAATSPAPTSAATPTGTAAGTVAPVPTPAATTPTASTPAAATASSPRDLTRELSNGPTPTPAADPKAMGSIRVRTFDKGSSQYFATKYSLHLPDGRWLYGTLRTAAGGEGWGTAIPRMPGRYEIEITDFVCGDKIWFLKDPLRRTIQVLPGQPADVTVEMDLASLPARRSLDNPTAAKCTAGPGGIR